MSSTTTPAANTSLRDRVGSPFKSLQKVGKAFMLPIAVLPAAGLLLGIGGALSNPNTVAAYPFLKNSILQAIFTVMADAGAVVFTNLPSSSRSAYASASPSVTREPRPSPASSATSS